MDEIFYLQLNLQSKVILFNRFGEWNKLGINILNANTATILNDFVRSFVHPSPLNELQILLKIDLKLETSLFLSFYLLSLNLQRFEVDKMIMQLII